MVDPATLPDIVAPPSKRSGKKKNDSEEEEDERKIDLSEIIGLPDFDVCPLSPSLDGRKFADSQEAARRNLTAKAWAYMKSGATDERSESFSPPITTLLRISPHQVSLIDQNRGSQEMRSDV